MSSFLFFKIVLVNTLKGEEITQSSTTCRRDILTNTVDLLLKKQVNSCRRDILSNTVDLLLKKEVDSCRWDVLSNTVDLLLKKQVDSCHRDVLSNTVDLLLKKQLDSWFCLVNSRNNLAETICSFAPLVSFRFSVVHRGYRKRPVAWVKDWCVHMQTASMDTGLITRM